MAIPSTSNTACITGRETSESMVGKWLYLAGLGLSGSVGLIAVLPSNSLDGAGPEGPQDLAMLWMAGGVFVGALSLGGSVVAYRGGPEGTTLRWRDRAGTSCGPTSLRRVAHRRRQGAGMPRSCRIRSREGRFIIGRSAHPGSWFRAAGRGRVCRNESRMVRGHHPRRHSRSELLTSNSLVLETDGDARALPW